MKTMKRIAGWCGLWCLLGMMTACGPKERTVVLLATNDMHAHIERFAQLAEAVEQCRDTAQIVFLVDAGDRWTGNAYVDMAENRRPILELMNRLRYDVATVGNHEFDPGQRVLGEMIRTVDFPVVCANLVSDTVAVPQVPPYVILEKGGVKVGFVGVVTNYEGDNRPAGLEAVFRGLTFPDPQRMAREYASIADRCDLLVLVSHMGTSHDREFLAGETAYDLVIGGHSHEVINERVNGTLLTQTGKNLNCVGATTVRLRGDEVVLVDFRLVPLADYEPDEAYAEQVEGYYANPELQRPVGSLACGANGVGLANLLTDLLADETDADVAFYHIGGVRLDTLAAGDVPLARVFDLEPFGSTVVTLRMTPEQMRRMVLDKYNDPVNTKESHRIDLYATTPYEIVVGADGDAVDVRFPQLREGKRYKVAMSDYIYKKYESVAGDDPDETQLLVTDLLLDELEEESPLTPDNAPRQRVRRVSGQ